VICPYWLLGLQTIHHLIRERRAGQRYNGKPSRLSSPESRVDVPQLRSRASNRRAHVSSEPDPFFGICRQLDFRSVILGSAAFSAFARDTTWPTLGFLRAQLRRYRGEELDRGK